MRGDAETEACPECGSENLTTDYRRAEVVCENCGAVVYDKVIKEAAGPMGEREGGDARIKPQLFFPGRDSEGRPVKSDRLWPLRNAAQTFNLNSGERAAILFEGRLKRLATQRNIPDGVTKRAVEIYYKVREARLFKKPNLNDLGLALLMAASRELRYIVTYEDLIEDPRKRISKVYKPFIRIFRMLGHHDEMWFSVRNFVDYYAGKLELKFDGETVKSAMVMIDAILRKDYDRSTPPAPHVMGAAALYIALDHAGVKQSQREYCKKVNLSEISLREWVNRMGPTSDLI